MERLTPVSGLTKAETDMELNFGQMALVTRECGEMIKQMARENLCTLTETSTKVSGSMIRQKALAHTHMQMGHTTKVNGWMTNNMAMESNRGPMVLDMRENMKTERKKDKADSHLLMAAITKANSRRMRSQVLEITTGPMENPTQATGVRTKWTVMECSPGKMAKNMRVTL